MSVTSLQYFHLTAHVIKAWPLQVRCTGLCSNFPCDPSSASGRGGRFHSVCWEAQSCTCSLSHWWGYFVLALSYTWCSPATLPLNLPAGQNTAGWVSKGSQGFQPRSRFSLSSIATSWWVCTWCRPTPSLAWPEQSAKGSLPTHVSPGEQQHDWHGNLESY